MACYERTNGCSFGWRKFEHANPEQGQYYATKGNQKAFIVSLHTDSLEGQGDDREVDLGAGKVIAVVSHGVDYYLTKHLQH